MSQILLVLLSISIFFLNYNSYYLLNDVSRGKHTRNPLSLGLKINKGHDGLFIKV